MMNVQQAVAAKDEMIEFYLAARDAADSLPKKQRNLLVLQANLTAIDSETNATDYTQA